MSTVAATFRSLIRDTVSDTGALDTRGAAAIEAFVKSAPPAARKSLVEVAIKEFQQIRFQRGAETKYLDTLRLLGVNPATVSSVRTTKQRALQLEDRARREDRQLIDTRDLPFGVKAAIDAAVKTYKAQRKKEDGTHGRYTGSVDTYRVLDAKGELLGYVAYAVEMKLDSKYGDALLLDPRGKRIGAFPVSLMFSPMP
jgi:hypothetical protein